MAKSVVSINHSGIRRDCACLSGAVGCWQSPPKATISVPSGRGEVRLNFVRPREQGGLVTDRSACKYVPERGVERVDLSLVATLAFFEPMNSGRGGKPERVPVGVEGGAPASASGK